MHWALGFLCMTKRRQIQPITDVISTLHVANATVVHSARSVSSAERVGFPPDALSVPSLPSSPRHIAPRLGTLRPRRRCRTRPAQQGLQSRLRLRRTRSIDPRAERSECEPAAALRYLPRLTAGETEGEDDFAAFSHTNYTSPFVSRPALRIGQSLSGPSSGFGRNAHRSSVGGASRPTDRRWSATDRMALHSSAAENSTYSALRRPVRSDQPPHRPFENIGLGRFFFRKGCARPCPTAAESVTELGTTDAQFHTNRIRGRSAHGLAIGGEAEQGRKGVEDPDRVISCAGPSKGTHPPTHSA